MEASLNVLPRSPLIALKLPFRGGFPLESIAQAIDDWGNTDLKRQDQCEGERNPWPVMFCTLLIFQ
ncbi:hypothetical protein [Thiolapillus sp.]